MQTSLIATPPQPYTILRIKRKRNEEPLDALVVEEKVRRKKSKGGAGVFEYAQTVEDDVWRDERLQKDIQANISRLARQAEIKGERRSSMSAPPGEVLKAPPLSRTETSRTYTIVEHAEAEASSGPTATRPPRIIPTKELEKSRAKSDFKMYDAMPFTSVKPPSQADEEMEKFLPMLNDYLKIHGSDEPSMVYSPPPAPTTAKSNVSKSGSEDNDYVWDVFYHRPATLSEWNEAANVGKITGLPRNFDDFYDSASDSDEEVDDEADEDSNAEEYYKNDYPDEEGSSDEWHEESEYDDMMEYRDSAEQFDS